MMTEKERYIAYLKQQSKSPFLTPADRKYYKDLLKVERSETLGK